MTTGAGLVLAAGIIAAGLVISGGVYVPGGVATGANPAVVFTVNRYTGAVRFCVPAGCKNVPAQLPPAAPASPAAPLPPGFELDKPAAL